ncbi:MAG: 3-oxo-tetronate kinase [Pseudomonadota bacterium]
MGIVLGAIADDFTGATDLANTWVNQGVKTCQIIGAPRGPVEIGDAEAVVIALKNRTVPPDEAVKQSLDALEWLKQAGALQIVFKYCSTFDSTPAGNIGPVADALADALNSPLTVVCPAFPENGRTIYQGHLFVYDQLLAESSMKDHPLTPMTESSLLHLMSAQSRYATGLVPLQTVHQDEQALRQAFDQLISQGYRYAVVDAVTTQDLRRIGRALDDHPLVTGGSGIGTGLPQNHRDAGRLSEISAAALPDATGRALVVAGSCSAATRSQIQEVQSNWPTRKLDIDRLAQNSDTEIHDIGRWAQSQNPQVPVVIYGSSDPAEVAEIQSRYGAEKAGRLIEQALGRIAVNLVDHGFGKLVVAGGETSGAVVSALGVRVLTIGPEIAPGVPWTKTQDGLALALKSGNFGDTRFFADALEMLP